jgi:DNA modification methylase
MLGTDYPGNPPERNLGNGILGPYTRFFRLPIHEPASPRLFVIPKPSKRERGPANDHPTVKPVSLFRHLIRLVTPPGETVCDPFMGSGTTAVSAIYEGVPFVGIERRKAYARIAERRVRDAQRQLCSQTRIRF